MVAACIKMWLLHRPMDSGFVVQIMMYYYYSLFLGFSGSSPCFISHISRMLANAINGHSDFLSSFIYCVRVREGLGAHRLGLPVYL